MDNIKLTHGNAAVLINPFGAELSSVKICGKEYLWEGDPQIWSGQAPVLFPICGGLKDDKFIFENREYTLKKHGFARNSLFKPEKITENSATFLLTSSKETLSSYPFDFEFRVAYTLNDNTLSVSFSVKNTGDKTMFFGVGAHEAYALPEGIENYCLVFEKDEEFYGNQLDGNLLSRQKFKYAEKGRILPLKAQYFDTDAIILSDIKSRSVILKNQTNGENIKVSFSDCDYLLIWQKPGAKYICIEPWTTLPDFIESDNRLESKEGIIVLSSKCERTISHTVEFSASDF